MARLIHAEYPTEHAGITRVIRGFAALASLDRAFTRAVLGGMAAVGAPAHRIAARSGRALAGWIAARKQRQADARLWNMALTDARIMADLSRAMDRDALRDARGQD